MTITHVNIDPKYIKEGTEVVICNSGSAFYGLTGHITGHVSGSLNVYIEFDRRSLRKLKENGLSSEEPVPFNSRELCVVEDDPEEDENPIENLIAFGPEKDTHEIVDFGPGPQDNIRDYPCSGSEEVCTIWLRMHQETRPDGTPRYAMQEIPPDE